MGQPAELLASQVRLVGGEVVRLREWRARLKRGDKSQPERVWRYEADAVVLPRRVFTVDGEPLPAASTEAELAPDRAADAEFSSRAGTALAESGPIRFRLSDSSVDRFDSTINVDGWMLSNYRKNPVVLYGHNYGQDGQLPIGTSLKTWTENGWLLSDDDFAKAATVHELAAKAERLIRLRVLRACSVGFAADEYEYDAEKDLLNFTKQDLLEHSIVPVPAHPGALQAASAAGVDVSLVTDWARHALDESTGGGLWLDKDKLHAMLRALGLGRGVKFFDLAPAELKREIEKRVKGDPTEEVDRRANLPYHKEPVKDGAWDAGKEVKAASVDDLKKMCCGYRGDGSVKVDFYLPHHFQSDKAVSKSGMHAAAARLNQTQGNDAKADQTHLGKHYADAGETPPWEKSAEAWARYVELSAGELPVPQLVGALRALGFEAEAEGLLAWCHSERVLTSQQEPGYSGDAEDEKPGDPEQEPDADDDPNAPGNACPDCSGSGKCAKCGGSGVMPGEPSADPKAAPEPMIRLVPDPPPQEREMVIAVQRAVEAAVGPAVADLKKRATQVLGKVF